MKKVNFGRAMEQAKFHASVVIRGFARTIYGALITGLLGLAIYGFVVINSETGYHAVFDFVAACATLLVAVCNMYLLGCKKRGAKK